MRKSRSLYGPLTDLVLTGGGTGGHVVPALELAKAHLRISSGSVLYVGSPGSLEERLSLAARVPFASVPSGGFVGKSAIGKMNALLKVARGVDAAHGILKKVRPGLVVGTGGYVQIPVVCAAILQGIPVVLLEPNKVTGLANRIFQPWVARLVRADGKGDPVGIPVSPEMLGPPPTRERFLGDHLRIMVLGGSQGARFLNEKIPGILKEALSKTDRRVEILHQSGERWKDSTTTRYRDLGLDARVEGFVPGLSSRFAEQTLIVARAGAMTVAEITASGTPAIYVPFPFSAGGHQKMNAEGVQAKGAGWCWTEGDLDNAGIRAKELSDILFAPDRLFDMAVRAWNSSTAVSAESWLQALGGRNE